jgi:hypothetical protein
MFHGSALRINTMVVTVSPGAKNQPHRERQMPNKIAFGLWDTGFRDRVAC